MNQLARHSEVMDHGGLLAAGRSEAADEQVNLWRMLDERLRGRWRIAIIIGLTLGAAFGIAGYVLSPVKFVAEGRLEGLPEIKPILGSTPETGMLPMFQQYLSSEAVKVTSEPVIDLAMRDERLAKYDLQGQPDYFQEFKSALGSSVVRNTNLISVTFESEDRQLAADAVNAVLDAYNQRNPASQEYTQRFNELGQVRRSFEASLASRQEERNQIIEASRFLLIPLDEVTRIKADELARYQEELRRIDTWIAELGVEADASGDDAAADDSEAVTAEEPPSEIREPTQFELDQFNRALANLREQVARAELELAEIRERVAWEGSPSIRRQETIVATLKKRLEEMTIETREQWMLQKTEELALKSNELWAAGDIDSLQRQRDAVQKALDEVTSELRQIRTEDAQLRRIDAEISVLETRLKEAVNAIENLQVNEASLRQGRIQIASRAFVPSRPEKDRRKQLAVVGFVGGCGIGIGMFLLLGTIDRRAYAAAQLHGGSLRSECIGVLPDMAGGPTNADACDLASQCVHRIRNRIEMKRIHTPERGYVMAVTSPFQGDGKTSVAMALGWSYAASGCKTILVDLDFIGRSLSFHTNRLRKPGVKEVLRSNVLNGEVASLTRENLSVLGIGMDPGIGPENLRTHDITTLFQLLRERFDIIIVDTGPLLASVESLPIAVSADGVLLALRRGRPRTRLEECVNELRHAGGQYLGVVLNCADRSDCERYASLSRLSVEVNDDDEATASASRASRNSLMNALEYEEADDAKDRGA